MLGSLDYGSYMYTGTVWLRCSTNCRSVGVLSVAWLLLFLHGGSAERGGASLFAPQILVCKALSLSVTR